jgi:non-reducing end alpha-L-arabinofuranosidase
LSPPRPTVVDQGETQRRIAARSPAAAQDAFCLGGSTCTISIIYDQSPNKNDLQPAPGGGNKASPDIPANAADLKTTLGGHEVYGLFIKSGMGYRAGCAGCGVATSKGTATGDKPETEYMVTSQNGLVDSCCFDYGNAETDARNDGSGSAEAVYFGGGVVWGIGSPGGHNNGPWVMADLENGLYAGWTSAGSDQDIPTNLPLKTNFVTAIVVGDTATQNSGMGRFALYGADATGGTLMTLYDGIRPAKTGYVPMHKQGSIVLGIAGDNSATAGGQWFEGVMANGAATLATLSSLQASIVAARYGN